MLRQDHIFLGITSTLGEKMSLAQENNTPIWVRIGQNVEPDLGQNCLKGLSADDNDI